MHKHTLTFPSSITEECFVDQQFLFSYHNIYVGKEIIWLHQGGVHWVGKSQWTTVSVLDRESNDVASSIWLFFQIWTKNSIYWSPMKSRSLWNMPTSLPSTFNNPVIVETFTFPGWQTEAVTSTLTIAPWLLLLSCVNLVYATQCLKYRPSNTFQVLLGRHWPVELIGTIIRS